MAHTSPGKGATQMETNEPVQSGIRCEAENCVYNTGCGSCTADKVCIRRRSDEPECTVCDTFREI